MSYARFGADSDVYVYLDCGGYFACCACWLTEQAVEYRTTDDIIDHLGEHMWAGHRVPQYAAARLDAERAENDDWIANYRPALDEPSYREEPW